MLDDVTLAYGGIDGVVVTAGVFVPPDITGHIPDEKWAQTFAVNVTGAYLVADEVGKVWKEQGLKGNFILTTSVNAVVAKKGSLAYDTSKAAANHLVRELALELAPLVRVNGVAPATVVEGSSMFPRDRVMASLAKYKIVYSETDSDDVLRSRLAQFARGTHVAQTGDHSCRPGRGSVPAPVQSTEQNDRSDPEHRWWLARGVSKVNCRG